MSTWKAPKGYTLTRHEGYYIDRRGFRQEAPPVEPMPDGQIDVAHFNEDQPFYEDKQMKPGPGYGNEGYSPDVTLLPIEDGWVPPVYTLHHDDDPTPVVEPARVLGEETT